MSVDCCMFASEPHIMFADTRRYDTTRLTIGKIYMKVP